jgi:hypothetical protein
VAIFGGTIINLSCMAVGWHGVQLPRFLLYRGVFGESGGLSIFSFAYLFCTFCTVERLSALT